MIDMIDIEKVARRLADASQAEAVVLFGSYARGNPSENSDVDFLVIAPSDQPRFKRSRELYWCMNTTRLEESCYEANFDHRVRR